MKKAELSLCVQYADADTDAPPRWRVRAWVASALAGRAAQLTVRFVGTAESSELNRRYRKRNGATNVLSFAYADDVVAGGDANNNGDALVGDIAVCCPLVRREAVRYRLSVNARYAHLVVHGVLHILGYEHGSDAARRRMETREKMILSRFKIPDPYLCP